MITAEDYSFLIKFLAARSGMELGIEKLYLVRARLEPVAAAHQLSNLSELVAKLRRGQDLELEVAVVSAMTTNETYFFREAGMFDVFQNWLLPLIYEKKKNTKSLRIWSAACSTGQEPYSISMSLALSPRPFHDWIVEILATDISESVMNRAKTGLYNSTEINRGLPEETRKRFFTKENDNWRIVPEIARRVVFKHMNLMNSADGVGSFDIIFCCNVLIYFGEQTKKTMIKKFTTALPPDGYLILGAAENVIGSSDIFESAGKKNVGIYKKRGSP